MRRGNRPICKSKCYPLNVTEFLRYAVKRN